MPSVFLVQLSGVCFADVANTVMHASMLVCRMRMLLIICTTCNLPIEIKTYMMVCMDV